MENKERDIHLFIMSSKQSLSVVAFHKTSASDHGVYFNTYISSLVLEAYFLLDSG